MVVVQNFQFGYLFLVIDTVIKGEEGLKLTATKPTHTPQGIACMVGGGSLIDACCVA